MIDLDKSLNNLYKDNDIEIPTSLRRKLDKVYEEIESKKKKTIKKNVLKVAGLIIALLIGTNFIKPSLAEELPIFGPVIKVLNNKWGLGIKYTENGLVVKEDFHTENHTLNIEAVDYRGDQVLLVYKIINNNKIDMDNTEMYSLDIDISGEDFIVDGNTGIDTGGVEDGVCYGYSLRRLNFEKGLDNRKELTVKISPKGIRYFKGDEDVIEEIKDTREINLTIKNKNFR
ncbi:hypothetical protein [Clostridium sp.]|uniref:hypothetical protein n=1 Tax=Clostridium sp. TaxID=1506 RepID=UPI0029068D9C|nr:hypothetical protein [Clostridium sp.]MDU5105431.1 hypothetical protein [Clostridium sp.]